MTLKNPFPPPPNWDAEFIEKVDAMSDELKHLTDDERLLLGAADSGRFRPNDQVVVRLLASINAERATLRALLATILGREIGDDVAASREAAGVVGKMREAQNGCPCRIVEPCMKRCTCANSNMGGGCIRCARYGSEKQRRDTAEWIAKVLDAAAAALAGAGEAGGTEGGKHE